MKAIKNFTIGDMIQLPDNDLLYFVRSSARNGRVHLKAFVRKTNERFEYMDRYLPNTTLAIKHK